MVYPSAVGSRLDTLPSAPDHCGICHYDFKNGNNPWNYYGWAIKTNGVYSLGGNDLITKSNAIYYVRLLDSDGDGFNNQTEITDTINYDNTPTFPGLSTGNTNLIIAGTVNLGEIANYLTPAVGGDTVPPVVNVISPNGGEIITANQLTNITWSAMDASGIASVKIHLSLDNGATYRALGLNLANLETFGWVPANRPTTQARIKVTATDTYGNATNDISDSVFTIVSSAFTNDHGVATTLRDFDLPGTQPLEHGIDLEASSSCASCHGGYDPAVEPQRNWQGSMMAHASRDPLFLANFAIANQDAAESGDLCLRCHFPRGWLAGRSVPTDGSSMLAADADGVSCALCHRMVDPVYAPGSSPAEDAGILAGLSFPGTNFGNGMFVIDPTGTRRGPFADAVPAHIFLTSPFHQEAAFCGTCHDVSNPAFQREDDNYIANAPDTTATNFSANSMGPVERTYSEWLHSDYNTVQGIYAPQFAGNKAGGYVSTCQDCHLRDVSGVGCTPILSPPVRTNLPLHDMTGGSTWLPGLLTNLFPAEVNAVAVQAGIERSIHMLTNAASLGVAEAGGQLKVTVTNECGHKLPTGYPEGRRIWLNIRFYDDTMTLVGESGAYNDTNGVLIRDVEAKVYEIHPGLETNLANALDLPPGPSFHFVLNNRVYEDNRIPPRGYTHEAYEEFGGEPVGHDYEDGQYWDDTLYNLPAGATKAVVKLYYQSTSKEFVEFLRDENRTTTHGQAMYELWATNGMCPPTLMAEEVWLPIFELTSVGFTPQGHLRTDFRSRPGVTYAIEFTDSLSGMPSWSEFNANGSLTATNTASWFEDDFSANSSGGASATGQRYYRFKFNGTP